MQSYIFAFEYTLRRVFIVFLSFKTCLQLPCEPICESIEPTAAPVTVTPAPTKTPVTQVRFDLYGVTDEDIINQIGSDEPIPEDAIKIIHGENTNVTIGK